MIKIALIRNVSPNNLFGGIRKHCQDLYSLFQDDKDIFIEPIENISGGYISLINKRFFHFKALYKYLKHSDCDIVHIHGFMSLDVCQTILMAKLLGKTIVYSPHFHPFAYLQNPNRGKIYFHVFIRPLLRFVSAIVTISTTDSLFFEKYHKTVIRIPHQFDSSQMTYTPCEKNKNMILFVGRNEENKGLNHLYQLPPKYEVHCVTKGKLFRSDFILHSNISNEELGKLYDNASLVVIPSRYEAFSYVALEAFAHGTPVVMSDTVCISDYLDGLSGYHTFKYGDIKAFIKVVDNTIGTRVDRENVLSKFEKSKIKQMYKEVYKQVLKDKKS